MDLLALFIVSLLIASTIVYLVTYSPIKSTIWGRAWSPRLTVCRLLIPADIILTITLVLVPMFAGVSGIMVFIASAFTALGLSVGVFFIRKVMTPIWKRKYEQLKSEEFVVTGRQIAC